MSWPTKSICVLGPELPGLGLPVGLLTPLGPQLPPVMQGPLVGRLLLPGVTLLFTLPVEGIVRYVLEPMIMTLRTRRSGSGQVKGG
jgi:hypothetical protein